jgi:hypothetical protein
MPKRKTPKTVMEVDEKHLKVGTTSHIIQNIICLNEVSWTLYVIWEPEFCLIYYFNRTFSCMGKIFYHYINIG